MRRDGHVLESDRRHPSKLKGDEHAFNVPRSRMPRESSTPHCNKKTNIFWLRYAISAAIESLSLNSFASLEDASFAT